jgi:hypothetical protein
MAFLLAGAATTEPGVELVGELLLGLSLLAPTGLLARRHG